MGTSSSWRKNSFEPSSAALALADLETRATKDDHQALRLWLRLLSCTVRVENYVRGRLRQEFGTTLPRFDLMAQLERHPDGLRMSELSKRLMVSGGNITGVTDQLEREELVMRTLDREDRRAITVKLSEKGVKRFREMAASHEQWIIELLSGLNGDDKHTMLTILRKLKDHSSRMAMAPMRSRLNQSGRRK
jgi:DNA-binding MarR family transcriptional regulator